MKWKLASLLALVISVQSFAAPQIGQPPRTASERALDLAVADHGNMRNVSWFEAVVGTSIDKSTAEQRNQYFEEIIKHRGIVDQAAKTALEEKNLTGWQRYNPLRYIPNPLSSLQNKPKGELLVRGFIAVELARIAWATTRVPREALYKLWLNERELHDIPASRLERATSYVSRALNGVKLMWSDLWTAVGNSWTVRGSQFIFGGGKKEAKTYTVDEIAAVVKAAGSREAADKYAAGR